MIARNDNWAENANQQEIIDAGLAPTGPSESAILTRLPSNESGVAYTAVLRGANDTIGTALLEIYDLDRGLGSSIANISARGSAMTGDNVMIGGFIAVGPSTMKLIVRAIGPSLVNHGITNPLHDPTLELHNGNGTLIGFNDNWKDSQQAEIQATGLAPSDDAESAVVQTVAPGNYTVIVRGKNDTTGVALAEVYALN
jgi:hypothetical protein